MTVKVALLVGSFRRDSLNARLANALIRLGESKLSFTNVRIDDLPFYNQDLESDPPDVVNRLRREIAEADAYLFVTPEYNRAPPAVLKNAIDWATRPSGHNRWTGKPGAVTGTSPGAIATAVAQQHLRTLLTSCGVYVMGHPEAYISYKPDLVNDDGIIVDEKVRVFLQGFIDKFADFAGRFPRV